MKMLKPPAVYEKLAMGKTSVEEKYIRTGRARWIYDGRSKRMPEHEVDRLILEDIAAADAQAKAGTKPRPAFSREQVLRGSRNSKKLTGRTGARVTV